MNKIIITAVFIFWAALSFFYASSLFKTKDTNIPQTNNTNVSTDSPKSALGLALASHNQASDCWLAINGKIYAVSSYINQHPGGAQEIIKYCGQDATHAFATMDKRNPKNHSQSAYALLENYYIGDLNAAATDNTNNATSTNTTQTNNNTNTNNNKPEPLSYTLTAALVAQHSTANDCWVTANNNVYNVSSYINSHPGGANNITKYCGKDIAAAFARQGHSANASNIFASYKIGTIGSNVTQNATTPAAPVNNQNNNGNNEEEDDD